MLDPKYLGCGQITWRGTDPSRVLAEISQAGYAGAPFLESDADTPQALKSLFNQFQLQPAPGYFSEAFWQTEREREILDKAHRHAAWAQALGLTETFVAAAGTSEPMPSGRTRRQAAGNVSTLDLLPDADFQRLVDMTNRIGEITLQYGVRSCFHNHVGTPVETEEEYELWIERSDPDLVFLGPDTGHLYWGGTEPLSFIERHIHRIKALHIKDVDREVVRKGRDNNWDYATTTGAGLWQELGEGCIDFPALFTALGAASYDGWIIVETDVTRLATPLASAITSRQYLHQFEVSSTT